MCGGRDRGHHQTRRGHLALVILTVEVQIEVAVLEDTQESIGRRLVALETGAVPRESSVMSSE